MNIARSRWRYGLLFAFGFMLLPLTINAVIVAEQWGTDPPKTTLGGYYLEAFEADGRALGEYITTIDPPAGAPVTGTVVSDAELEHTSAGAGGWFSWSHGYTGDVYWFDELTYGTYDDTTGIWSSSHTLTLPTDTKAFYLYIEPNFFDTYEFVIMSGSASETISVAGNGGAQGLGFYTDNPADSLLSIIINRQGAFADGYGIGEFGINGATPPPPGAPEGGVPAGVFGLVVAGLFTLRSGLARMRNG